MTTITYFCLYFDRTGQKTYLPILHKWVAAYRKHVGKNAPIGVLTDTKTVSFGGLAPYGDELDCLMVDPRPFQDCCREGNHFDYKSALICAALPQLPPESVVMDCDAIIAKDPTAALEAYANEPFCMVPDSGKRSIPWRTAGGEIRVPEHSSSVMMFGGPKNAAIREALGIDYRKAWHWLQAFDDAKQKWLVDIREQRAWSLVHHWSEATLMEPRLNWSIRHWGPSDDAFINHHHGDKKMERINKVY
jgi:hypothetical protein